MSYNASDIYRDDEKVINIDRATESRPRLVLIHWSEIHTLPKRSALVADLLDNSAMSVLFGGSNTGKTFLALDLSAHVAMGQDWRGRKVKPGAVLYIAAEGGLGIEERLTAFRLHHNVDVENVPFWVIPEPIDLCKADVDTNLLVQRISAISDLRLIVIDTLSRAMSGGNENSPDDMGKFVAHCDRLRLATGAHVMVIHHSGKDDSRGARGHSLLKAAADTEIEVNASDTGIRSATIVKQRDHRIGDVFSFRLLSVDIGQDDGGKSITSCVVEAVDEPIGARVSRTARLPKAAQTALRALAEAINEQGEPAPTSPHIPDGLKVISFDVWREHAYRRGISAGEADAKRKAFTRAAEQLIAVQKVGTWDNLVWLCQ